jgi:Trypsin
MGRTLFRLIRCLTTACCALSPVVAGAENVGSVGLPLTGGTSDVGASLPQANVVVRLSGATGSCTGTLLTPTLILTARHCING